MKTSYNIKPLKTKLKFSPFDDLFQKSMNVEDFEIIKSSNYNNDIMVTSMLQENTVIEGAINSINRDYVLVCINYKSEGQIPISEFGGSDIKIGDTTKVFLEKLENREGKIVLSRIKAIKCETWSEIEQVEENNGEIEGKILYSTRSGYIVDIKGIMAFLPNSHVDIKPVKNSNDFINYSSS